MLSTLPTTSHYIQHHATVRPDSWALHCPEKDIAFKKLHADLRFITAYLSDLTIGCSKKSIVEVCIDDLYLNWLVLLALENLGFCSSSVAAVEHISSVENLWPVSLIICTETTKASKPLRTLCLDSKVLLDREYAFNPTTWPIHNDNEDVLRITKTSGTTGSPKRIAVTRQRHDGAMARWQWLCSYSPQSVCWIHAPFSVGGMYSSATACLRAGGAVVLNDRVPFEEALKRYKVTHATLLPIELSQILKINAHRGATFDQKIMLTLFGGAVPLDHFEQALDNFAHDVVDIYGTNEVGLVGLKRRNHFDEGLALFPGVEIDICDSNSITCAFGLAGYVRIRTLQMVPHYLDTSDLSVDNFKDGWFWPGDMGHVTGTGLLKLLGRQDDLLNLGGVKVNPEAMEAEFKKLSYLSDVALVMKNSEDHTTVITIAIVPKEAQAVEKMETLVADKLKSFSSFMVVKAVSAIPRTSTGKVERKKLKDLLD